MGMGRGGMYRGGRGRGGAGRGGNRGPQLPRLLQQQLQGSTGDRAASGLGSRGSGRGGGGRGGGSSRRPSDRKAARRAARQEKKHHRFEVQRQQGQQRHAAQQQKQQRKQQAVPAVGQKRAVPQLQGASEIPAAKRQKKQPGQPQPSQQQRQAPRPAAAPAGKPGATGGTRSSINHSSSKTRFFDLLASEGVVAGAAGAGGASAAGLASQAAFLADLRLQRDMERQLKLKKRKASGPEDGLDALLAGITAGSQLLPAGLTADDAAAAGGGSSDDDEEQLSSGGEDEESDDESGNESDDDEDARLASDEGDGDSDDLFARAFAGSEDEESDEGEDEESEGGEDEESEGEEDEESPQEGSELMSGEGDSGSEGQGGWKEEGSSRSQGASEDEDGGEAAAGSAGPKAAALAPDAAAAGAGRYIPPALRRAQEAAAAAAATGAGAGSGLAPAVQRRITGLLNRLAEANVQPIARELLTLYEAEGRRRVADAVAAGLLGAAAEGPRATEQFAAVAAVLVGALAALARAQDISARFLELLAARLEQAYAADDGLACHNLIMLLAYCYSSGLVAADCMYSVLGELTRRFSEPDVAMMLTLLNAVGLQLRAADPLAMKDFVLAVHSRAAAAGQSGGMTKRAQIMLELVMDIKNNRAREVKAGKAAAAAATAAGANKAAAAAAGAAAGRGGAAAMVQPGLLKWLKQCGIDDVTLANISWAKLVQPDKKGMWWHPSATDAAAGLLPGLLAESHMTSTAAAAAAAAAADDDGDDGGGLGGGAAGGAAAVQLLRLAASLKMNTDARRAVFVAIMGSEDCAEASEKLLRLPVKGDQSREVVRVLVECCLQEAAYNPYYGHLAARLAAVSKSHKVTLQYCLWDQWKEVATTEPRRLLCLAGLVGQLLSSFVLPLSTIKPIDFDAAASWTGKEVFLWRHTLAQLLQGFKSDDDADAAFARLAAQQQLGGLARALGLFLRLRVGPWLVAQGDAGAMRQQLVDSCLARLARGEKILLSSAAAVLAG